ncbi:response regulator [Dyadobacter sp. CY323]|uniref:response regulator n=1 Tax=Dyadobacter sp. CY323 TaxID=2907302 RepID=UPI001F3B0770|nr:response regulator [Dyadobacter sp. CY323]MCE6989594.1 response regulator [Dyadobacter sp. CY323]
MKLPSQFIVVDDDRGNNLICKYAIASIAPHARIQLFTEPEKALEWIKKDFSNRTEDLSTALFLDINMPVMNGWEFLDKFSSFPSGLQAQYDIFILSSSIDPEDKEKAEKHPLVQGYYSKPLRKETINQIFST